MLGTFLVNAASFSFLLFPISVISLFAFAFYEPSCDPATMPKCMEPSTPDGGAIRLSLRASTSPTFARVGNPPEGIFFQTTILVGNEDEDIVISNTTFPATLRDPTDRRTLWLHVNVLDADGNDVGNLVASVPMTIPCARRVSTEKFLMNGTSSSSSPHSEKEEEEVSGKCWRNRVTIYALQSNASFFTPRGLQPMFIPINPYQTATNPLRKPRYLPVLRIDEEELTKKEFVPLSANQSRAPPTFRLRKASLRFGWYRIKSVVHEFTLEYRKIGVPDELIDTVLYEMSPRRLRAFVVHTVASHMHSFFAFLAFKNDVSFFRRKAGRKGISMGSLMGAAIQSLITFLWLEDQEVISSVVLVMQGVATAVAFWKCYRVWMDRRGEQGQAAQEGPDPTAAYDVIAIKYIGSVCAVLFVGYACYALNTFMYKSMWSWLISNLAHASYTYGFVLMTPQLYVNYRLKSVAHLPWRALTYKAFTTFVDDVSAWLIGDLPLAYKIACCRDDVVFFILMYQRYVYATDKTRVNEFGGTGEEDPATDDVVTTLLEQKNSEIIKQMGQIDLKAVLEQQSAAMFELQHLREQYREAPTVEKNEDSDDPNEDAPLAVKPSVKPSAAKASKALSVGVVLVETKKDK